MRNAERTRNFFKNYSDLYIPENYFKYGSKRIIVMEYMEGINISDID